MSEKVSTLELFNGLDEKVRLKLQCELRDEFLELLELKNEFEIWLRNNFDDILKKIINKIKTKING